MGKTSKILSLVLVFAMALSLGCVSFAADSDWSEYQDYIYSYAEAGAPNPEDAVEMADAIYACKDMDDIRSASNIQVFFDVLGALDFEDWLAAGKPEADMNGGAGGGSGEASGEASGEGGENAVISIAAGEIRYVSDGVEKTAEIGEGQTAYLSVDGVNVPLEEGAYNGSVAVDVVDPIFESADYQSGDKDVDLSTELASVIYITDEGLQEGQSILSAATGGEITDTKVSGVTIGSDVAAVSGIRAGGSAEIEVEDVVINLTGEGGNDFMGQGAALCATDGSHLIARNVTANVSGYVRGCTFAGGQSTLEVYDSVFNCDAGDYNEDASVEMAGMSQPPKGLGVYGNARANNMVHYATEYFENCVFNNRNWGALGVDAVNDGSLTCVDCEINVTESGYGAYSIGPCVDTFKNCRFNIHNGVVAFAAVEGTVILSDGTVANSDRYGLVTHQPMGSVSTLKVLGEGTELNTAYCGIMIKSRSADIEIGDGAVVTASETGVLVQAQDNDDTGAGTVNASAEIPVYIHDTALEGDIVMSMSPLAYDTATMNVTLENAELTGAISLANATLAIDDGVITFDNILSVGRVENEYAPREDGCLLNVTLGDGAVWNVTETSYLSSLTLNGDAVVNGTVTDCGDYIMVEPAAADVYAESDVTLTFTLDGAPIASFTVSVSLSDGDYVLGLRNAIDALGLALDYDETTGILTVTDENGLLLSLLSGEIPVLSDAGIFSVEAGEPYAGRPAAELIEGERYVAEAARGGSVIYISGGEHTFDDIYVYGAGYSSEDDLSAERSSQYGYCSDILATSPDTLVTLNNPTIVSDPESYANGAFATNRARIVINGGTIDTNNSQGHGLDVTYMGRIYAYDTVIHTAGGSSGALASDYGGGFILAEGVDCTTEKAGSPGIYCAGSSIIMAKDSRFVANNCEGVMSAHDHGVTVLDNCYTYGETSALNGHQAMPSAAMSTGSYCFVFGGTLESGSGPVIREENGRTEDFIVGAEMICGDYPYAVEATDDNAGILTVNLWDTELTGDIYCSAESSITLNLYAGAKLTGEVFGEGEVIINVYDGGEYVGSYSANECGAGEDAPACGDFDYYLVNYWAAGMQKWQNATITTYLEDVEPIIVEGSLVSFVTDGASAIAYDPATADLSENGIDPDALDTTSAIGFGEPGDGVMGLTSGEPSAE